MMKNGGGKDKGGGNGNDPRGTKKSPYSVCPNCVKKHNGQCKRPLGFKIKIKIRYRDAIKEGKYFTCWVPHNATPIQTTY